MEGLAVAIQQGEVHYPAGVLTNELEIFEYEYTRTDVRYSAAAGLHDDCVCALALAVQHGVDLHNRPRLTGNRTAVSPLWILVDTGDRYRGLPCRQDEII